MRDGEPLRIGLLTHSVNPRGGVVHTLELARALHDAGHGVTVFAPAAPGQALFRTMPCAVELVPVAAGAAADVPAMVASRIAAFEQHLAPRLAGNAFDVVHAQDPIGANALAHLQQRGLIDGFVRTVHHLDDFTDPRLRDWQRRGFESARQVLCVSRLWCDVLRQAHGIEAALVHNGVDLARHTPRPAPGDDAVAARLGLNGAPLFLAVGGIEKRKNTLRILHAFIALRAAMPDAQLVIAGGASLLDHDEEHRRFDALRRYGGLASGPGEALVLTGPLPDAEMPALMRRADALLLPSLREGFGLVVLEALACGTPVVVSRMAPFTEYLDSAGDSVAWCDPNDVPSITRAMRQAAQPGRKAALQAATPAVCHRFNWPASAARHAALYRARQTLARQPSLIF